MTAMVSARNEPKVSIHPRRGSRYVLGSKNSIKGKLLN